MRYALFFFTLICPTLTAAEEPLKVQVDKEVIRFYYDSKLLTAYHFGPQFAKPYFYPMHAPGGVPVTRAWPMEKGAKNETTDHPHQKSAWFCHGDVIPEGITLKLKSLDKRVEGVDFWSETPGHGKIVCIEQSAPSIKDGVAIIQTKNHWTTADGVKILAEDRIIQVKPVEKGFLIRLDIHLHAAYCGVTFGDTKEGSLGIRMRDEAKVQKGNGKMVNAEGKNNEKAVWGQFSNWCDYSGMIDEKPAGIAIFDHPQNSSKAAWHSRDYGLMAANPFGRSKAGFPARKGDSQLISLKQGEKLHLQYGIYVHSGDAEAGKVAQTYAEYVK